MNTDPTKTSDDNETTPDQQSERDARTGADTTIADGSGEGSQQYVDSSKRAANSPEAATESTQENMGDGSGIRGDYGNSDQTNGKEGK